MNKINNKSKILTVFLFTSYFSLFTLTSCSIPQPQKNLESISINKKNISGKVDFEELKFKTKAAITDVVNTATISIITTSNSTTPNQVRATGLTTSIGTFSINGENFSPLINDIYVLEASKRLSNSLTVSGGVGNKILSVRTYIKWNGTNWTSITGDNIVINSKTTALTLLQGYDSTTIDPNLTINKISIDSQGLSTPFNIVDSNSNTLLTSQKILDLSVLVKTSLTEEKDPFSYIKKLGSIYSIDRSEDIANLVNNNCSTCNITNLDLTGIDLSNKNLSNATLTGLNLTNQNLTGTNFTNTTTGANLSKANLSGNDLTGVVKLSHVNGTEAYFENSDLSGLDMSHSNFTYAFFNNAKFIARNPTTNAIIKVTDLTGSNFSNTDLSNVVLTGCLVTSTTNFTGAFFKNTDISNMDMTGINLSGANLSTAILTSTNFTNANLLNANLTGAVISTAIFTGATWTDGRTCANPSVGSCN